MAPVSLLTNISSLGVQRNLNRASENLSRSFERLSSGLRITRASDDAAGLALSENLKLEERVFQQGLRNVNDGISSFSIAEGALNELTAVTIRLTELASQSATGSISNSQRVALNEEAQALVGEYNRIVASTDFNDMQLINGSTTAILVQSGFGSDGGVSFALNGAGGKFESEGNYSSGVTFSDTGFGGLKSADFDADGNEDILSSSGRVYLGNGNGTFRYNGAYTGATTLALGDFNNDDIVDYATSAFITLGNGNGSFKAASAIAAGPSTNAVAVGDFDGDGNQDIIQTDGGDVEIGIQLGNGNGTFRVRTTFAAHTNPNAVQTADFNGDGDDDIIFTDGVDGDYAFVAISNGNGTFKQVASFFTGVDSGQVEVLDLNDDGAEDFAVLSSNFLSVKLGNGNGTFKTTQNYTFAGGVFGGLTSGDFNGDGVIDLAAGSYDTSNVSVFFGNGNGTLQSALNTGVATTPWGITAGDFNNDYVDDLSVSGAAVLRVLVAVTESASGLPDIDISTQGQARKALTYLEGVLDGLSAERGNIGAAQSRLSSQASLLQGLVPNLSEARSRIVDVDVAEESANIVRTQIVRDAASAILAQANASPELALLLLGA